MEVLSLSTSSFLLLLFLFFCTSSDFTLATIDKQSTSVKLTLDFYDCKLQPRKLHSMHREINRHKINGNYYIHRTHAISSLTMFRSVYYDTDWFLYNNCIAYILLFQVRFCRIDDKFLTPRNTFNAINIKQHRNYTFIIIISSEFLSKIHVKHINCINYHFKIALHNKTKKKQGEEKFLLMLKTHIAY